MNEGKKELVEELKNDPKKFAEELGSIPVEHPAVPPEPQHINHFIKTLPLKEREKLKKLPPEELPAEVAWLKFQSTKKVKDSIFAKKFFKYGYNSALSRNI